MLLGPLPRGGLQAWGGHGDLRVHAELLVEIGLLVLQSQLVELSRLIIATEAVKQVAMSNQQF